MENARYHADKRESFPPGMERESGREYVYRVRSQRGSRVRRGLSRMDASHTLHRNVKRVDSCWRPNVVGSSSRKRPPHLGPPKEIAVLPGNSTEGIRASSSTKFN